MTFAVDGGIEWEMDHTNKVLTIRAASTPEEGYASGQMKDYDGTDEPWGYVTWTATLTIESGVTTIGALAFYNCTGLTGALTLPSGLTSIGTYAFCECSFTGALTIPDTVTTIREYAFQECDGFTGTLTLPSGLTTIENGVFWVTGLTGTPTIPDGVTSIGGAAFCYCTGFTGTLTIPSGVTTIGEYAFALCPNLDAVNLLGSQPTLGDNAFDLNYDAGTAKTYDVYGSWVTPETFPEYTYTKWNYPEVSTKEMKVKIGGAWKSGTPYVRVGGDWKQGTPYVRTGGVWHRWCHTSPAEPVIHGTDAIFIDSRISSYRRPR